VHHDHAQNHFGTRSKDIRFNDMADAYVDEIGDNEDRSISYYIVVKLKSGKTVPVFKGFFDGCYSESAITARCQHLMQYFRL